MIKILLHSITDLITNSSTSIFTYSESCEKAVRTMFDEILQTFGIDKKFDEMFKTVVLMDDYYYTRYIEERRDGEFPEENITYDNFYDELYKHVKEGKIEKPEWFNDAEEAELRCDYYRASNMMYIIAKEEKYEKIGKYIVDFLYSTDHEATRDG